MKIWASFSHTTVMLSVKTENPLKVNLASGCGVIPSGKKFMSNQKYDVWTFPIPHV